MSFRPKLALINVSKSRDPPVTETLGLYTAYVHLENRITVIYLIGFQCGSVASVLFYIVFVLKHCTFFLSYKFGNTGHWKKLEIYVKGWTTIFPSQN